MIREINPKLKGTGRRLKGAITEAKQSIEKIKVSEDRTCPGVSENESMKNARHLLLPDELIIERLVL